MPNLLPLLAAFLTGYSQPIPDLIQLPPALPVRILQPQSWSILELPRPVDPDEITDADHGITMKIEGREVPIKPTADYVKVDQVARGTDGSVLITRSNTGGLDWSVQYSIWFQGKEHVVEEGGVSVYRSHQDYAGSFLKDGLDARMPTAAPEGFYVRNGQFIDLGPGTVQYWLPDRLTILDVPVDDHFNPSGVEFTTGTVTRLIGPFGHVSIPGYEFLGAQKDGTVVLVSGSGNAQNPTGYVYLDKQAGPASRILTYKDGKVMSHFELPRSWIAVGLSPAGWILTRKLAPLKSHPIPDLKPGTRPEDVMRAMNADDDTGEQDWTMGVLSKGVLSPLRFPRPAGTEKLLWRPEDEVYGPNWFVFHVFFASVDRWFRLTSPR